MLGQQYETAEKRQTEIKSNVKFLTPLTMCIIILMQSALKGVITVTKILKV